MKVDYLVIGFGLAGMSFCKVLEDNNRSFMVLDHADISGIVPSSRVAGGLYNPVVLKRFTAIWKAKEQLSLLKTFYKDIENKLGIQVDYPIAVHRKFSSIEEQNDWFKAADHPVLSTFLDTDIRDNSHSGLHAPYRLGNVKHTGRIAVASMQEAYKQYLQKKGQYRTLEFSYYDVINDGESVTYQDIEAKHIVFAEGYGLKNNPYFNYLPLQGSKGELLHINAPGLSLSSVFKASAFLIPLDTKADTYILGATYHPKDKSPTITNSARQALEQKATDFLKTPYKVIDQKAGIRPTVTDRRPLVGTHPAYCNTHVLNGLGTRGVLIGPYAAVALYAHIEHQAPLDSKMDISRFFHLLPNI